MTKIPETIRASVLGVLAFRIGLLERAWQRLFVAGRADVRQRATLRLIWFVSEEAVSLEHRIHMRRDYPSVPCLFWFSVFCVVFFCV